jgi:hypothetical protein
VTPPRRRPRVTRSQRVVLAAVGAVAVAAMVVAMVVFLSRPTEPDPAGRGGDVQVRLGDEDFRAGRTDRLAARIASDGRPFLIADASPNRARDIYLQHEGNDPDEGWLAFAARAPDQDDRDCSLVWVPDEGAFADPCTAARFPADGEGLTQYETRVTDGILHVDLRAERQ